MWVVVPSVVQSSRPWLVVSAAKKIVSSIAVNQCGQPLAAAPGATSATSVVVMPSVRHISQPVAIRVHQDRAFGGDQFQLLSQQPRPPRDSEYLNRPYELSELMRLATDAGVWPRP